MSVVLPPPVPPAPACLEFQAASAPSIQAQAGQVSLDALEPRMFTYVPADPSLLWPLGASSRTSGDLFKLTPPRTELARHRLLLDTTSASPLSYASHPEIVHRILSLTDHETRIRCRLLCRDVSAALDYMLGYSIILSTLAIGGEPAVVLRSARNGRLPGLPPQSYDPAARMKNVPCFHPEVLRHTRILSLHNQMPRLKLHNLLPHLPSPRIEVVRDTFPNSRFPNPVPCAKYVTLTHLTDAERVGVPCTPPDVSERIFNVSCPRDGRAIYRSIVGPLRLCPTVRKVTVILNFPHPSIVGAEAFAPLAHENGLGILNYLANEVLGQLDGGTEFTVVGHNTAPPPALGFPTLAKVARRQLDFDIYQRILAHAPTNNFETYHRITRVLKFLSFEEYRAKVGEEEFKINVIG